MGDQIKTEDNYTMTQTQYMDLVITLRTISQDVKNLLSSQSEMKTDVKRLNDQIIEMGGEIKNIKEQAKSIDKAAYERYTENLSRIQTLEKTLKERDEEKEQFWSKVIEQGFKWIVPFIFFIIGLVLAKLGIINFD